MAETDSISICLLFHLSFNPSLLLEICFHIFLSIPTALPAVIFGIFHIFLTSDVRLFTLAYSVLHLVIFHSEHRRVLLFAVGADLHIIPQL